MNFQNDTVWLIRQQPALFFDIDVKIIGKHLSKVFSEGELSDSPTVAKFPKVQNEGGRLAEKGIEHYNLDLTISKGYRATSQHCIQFRQKATQRLKDYLVKGCAINQKRLEENKA